MSTQAEENYKKFKDKIYKGNKGSRKQELIDFADLHHKEQLEKIMPSAKTIQSNAEDYNAYHGGGGREFVDGAFWIKENLLKTIEK